MPRPSETTTKFCFGGTAITSVVVTDRAGTRHEDRITAETVEWLRDRLRGRQVDRTEAAQALALAPPRLKLPFTHGFKLGYYTQKVLLVLVARKEAGVSKTGRRFIYTIY